MLSFKAFLVEAIEKGSFVGNKTPNIKTLAKMSHKFIYHSGTADQMQHMKHGIEPQHGDWIKEVASGATEDHEEMLDRATPLVWLSDRPDWVKMKVGRKINKHVSDVTDKDIENHGHVAIVPRKGDHAEHIWHIGKDGLDNGGYSKVTNLKGKTKQAHHTDLYDSDYTGNKEPFGVERNEYVSARTVEPMLHLTGKHLVDFLKHVNQK